MSQLRVVYFCLVISGSYGFSHLIVDPGLFVISGVMTCGGGEGFCLLGLDCTVDSDFLPDDDGHCEGLRNAFTPSAYFSCCKVNTRNLPPSTPFFEEEKTPTPIPINGNYTWTSDTQINSAPTSTTPMSEHWPPMESTETTTTPSEPLSRGEDTTQGSTLPDEATEDGEYSYPPLKDNTIDAHPESSFKGTYKRKEMDEPTTYVTTAIYDSSMTPRMDDDTSYVDDEAADQMEEQEDQAEGSEEQKIRSDSPEMEEDAEYTEVHEVFETDLESPTPNEVNEIMVSPDEGEEDESESNHNIDPNINTESGTTIGDSTSIGSSDDENHIRIDNTVDKNGVGATSSAKIGVNDISTVSNSKPGISTITNPDISKTGISSADSNRISVTNSTKVINPSSPSSTDSNNSMTNTNSGSTGVSSTSIHGMDDSSVTSSSSNKIGMDTISSSPSTPMEVSTEDLAVSKTYLNYIRDRINTTIAEISTNLNNRFPGLRPGFISNTISQNVNNVIKGPTQKPPQLWYDPTPIAFADSAEANYVNQLNNRDNGSFVRPRNCDMVRDVEWKFMEDGQTMCYGVLIDAIRILTSASCVLKLFESNMASISAVSNRGNNHRIDGVSVHENFQAITNPQAINKNDLGIVTLRAAVPHSDQCLPKLPFKGQILRNIKCSSTHDSFAEKRQIFSRYSSNYVGADLPLCSHYLNTIEINHTPYLTLNCQGPLSADTRRVSQESMGSGVICNGILAGIELTSGLGAKAYTPLSQYVDWISRNVKGPSINQRFRVGYYNFKR